MKCPQTLRQIRHLTLVIGVLVCCWPLSASAQERAFQVELLIFQNLEGFAGGELFDLEDPDAIIEYTDTDEHTIEELPIPVPGLFQPVIRDALTLTETFGHLRSSRAFRPLRLEAWIQPGLSPEEAPPRAINATVGGVQIGGTARVYLSRYLHLQLDLEFENENRERFHLTERRRIKTRETHYFDHPKFGVIVRITPIASDSP